MFYLLLFYPTCRLDDYTLRDRIAGDIDLECCTMGAITLFSLGEEARLVSHLKEMANIGYGYSRY
jgi:hypothetical protein